ncbi:MAG: hypothetical protein ACRDSS_05760, partial [Actinocrinis sp.]
MSVSTAALVISAAVSVALIARLLLRGAGKSVSVGSHIGYTVVIVGVCAGLWVFLLMAADWCVARIASARSYVAGHRRRAVRIGLLVGAVPIMIALLYWVSVARRAGTPGLATGARVAAEVLGACGLSGGTVFLTLRPYLVGPRAGRRVRRFAAGASAWLTCGILLIALRVGTPGWVLVGVFGILMYGWLLFSDHRGMAGDGDFFRCYTGMAYATVGALLWLHVMSLTTLARWAGETALAVLTGAIASGVVWRRLRRAGRGLSRFAFAGATTVLAYVLFLLFDDQMLGGPLEAPLLVLMLWLSVRLWRWMSDEDRRLAVGAGADVVFALTLGSVLVVSLAWLANVLDLPPVEVGVLRDIASSVGQSAEIAPWIWGLVYGLLTAAYLTAAFGVRRSRALVRRMESARLTPAVAAARRTSTVLGIGLMLMAFLGLAAPPAVGPVLSHRIRERYTVAAQDRLTADDAVAVYQAIAQQLARSPANVAVLIEMFEDIHKQHPPTHGGDQPTSGELALSLRMGELQGRAAAVEQAASDPSDPVTDGRPDAEAAAEQSTDQQLARPLQDVSDLETRLAEEQGARERAEES